MSQGNKACARWSVIARQTSPTLISLADELPGHTLWMAADFFFFHSNVGEAGDRQALMETNKQTEQVTKGKEMELKRGI